MNRSLVLFIGLACAACAISQPSKQIDLARFQSERPDFGLTRGPDGWYLSRMNGPFGTDASSEMLRFPFRTGAAEQVTFGTGSHLGRDFSWDPASRRGCFVRSADIWCANWDGERWLDTAPLPDPVNTPGYEASPQIAADGSLYFSSMRDGGPGQGDIYRAVETDRGWQVVALGPAINSPGGEWNLALSPDNSMMVFEASGRATNLSPSGDLYLSCRIANEWQPAMPMNALNTEGSELDFRFTGPRSGIFSTARIGGGAVLRHAGPEHFAECDRM